MITVQPHEVHRSIESEFFLLEAAASGDTVEGTFKNRSAHPYYRFDDVSGSVNALYCGEVLRQSETYLAHAVLGRHGAEKFLWRSIDVRIVPVDVSDSGFGREDTFRISCVGARGGKHHYQGAARVGDSVVVLDDLAVSYVGPDLYQRIRGATCVRSDSAVSWARRRLTAREVDRDRDQDVSVGLTDDSDFCIDAQFTSPVYFEHVQDHWPGMTLIDAATQAHSAQRATAVSATRLTSLQCRFHRYAELSSVVRIVVQSNEDSPEISFLQEGHLTATVSLKF